MKGFLGILCRSAMLLALPFAGGRFSSAEDYTVLYSFSPRQGNPRSGLLAASDGRFYGTATQGGAKGLGSIYVLEPDGNGGFTYAEIFEATSDAEGTFFESGLVEGTDGLFYGVASFGGDHRHGVVYRVSAAGVYEKLASFDDVSGLPNGLIRSSDGAFYGMMSGTGHDGVFRFDSNGLVTLHEVSDDEGMGWFANLIEAGNGDFYGTAPWGGTFNAGTVFRVTAAGALTVLHTFTGGDDGAHPESALMQDGDGNIYGTTAGGGPGGNGTIFRIDGGDSFSTVHVFALGAVEGEAPRAALWKGSDGKLYGTTTYGAASGFGAVFRRDPDGTVSAVHAFAPGQGIDAQGSLIESSPGHLLGTHSRRGPGGYGTVFECDFGGAFSVLHAFGGNPEGFGPAGGVVEGPDGSLYGTTQNGGSGASGAVFRLDPSGDLTTLHAFNGADGAGPYASLAWGPDGRLYGTAYFGDGATRGSAFATDTLGNFQLLHAFTGGEDGGYLYAGLLPASDGNLYGVAKQGGAFRLTTSGTFTHLGAGEQGEGTLVESDGGFYGTAAWPDDVPVGRLFRMELDGSETVLHDFGPSPDGFHPRAGLVKASDGNFYGTTIEGGVYFSGTVFRMAPDGTTTKIYDFPFENGLPYAGLIQATDGFLYGTTWGGAGYGTVFRIDFSGTGFSTVHTFSAEDGEQSTASLIQAGDGSLVGTAFGGGLFRGGLLFRLALPPSPLAVTAIAPASGPADGGTSLTIAGSGFVAGAAAAVGGAVAPDPSLTAPTQIVAACPPLTPGTLNDVTVTNPDMTAATLVGGFMADFLDVFSDDIFHSGVEWAVRNGITVGCGGGNFCRDDAVTRAQMAVFLVKAMEAPGYQPPPATGTMFLDVPAGAFAADFIEDFAARGITAGCGGGNFCPDAPVTRAQMAVLLLKASSAPGYVPPDPTGMLFDDVPVDAFAAAWIEALAARGITAGCSLAPPLYCPDASNTRGQMAVLLQRTFRVP